MTRRDSEVAAPLREWPVLVGALRNLLAFRNNPLELFERATRRHGDFVRLSPIHHLVNDAHGAHHILIENASAYRKSRNAQALKPLVGEGLLTSEGDLNKRQKRLAQPAFHRAKIAGFAEIMARCAAEHAAEWRALAEREGRVDIHEEMGRLTFRVVGLCLLGVDLLGEAHEFGKALRTSLDCTNRRLIGLFNVPDWIPTRDNRAFRKARSTITRVLHGVIEERRRAKRDVPDLLGMLMAAKDEEGNMSEQQLIDEVITLIVAGHATTATSLTFTFMLLAQHPESLQRLRAEAEALLGNRLPTLDDAQRMPFARAVIDESLRLYPPVWLLSRDAMEPDTIRGYPVDRGAVVGVCTYVMHRNPAYYLEPETFHPERFLDTSPQVSAARKLAYLPFGAGPRVCIGNSFALLEMQIVLVVLARAVDLVPLAPGPIAPEPSVALQPRGGFPVKMVQQRRTTTDVRGRPAGP